MIFTGPKKAESRHLFLVFLFLAGVLAFPCAAQEGIAPERYISVIEGAPGTPEWKILWDRARNLVRSENYPQAAAVYSELYKHKPNIEEANWEYCKVLLRLADYSGVARIIAGLLEKNPNKDEYLLTGGQVAASRQDWEVAARYYGRVLEKDPAGQHSTAALEGLAISLRNQGKKKNAFTLFELLLARQPENLHLLEEMAMDADFLGYHEKARQLLKRLLMGAKVEDRVVLEAARLFEVPGYEQESLTMWQEYLERHPEYLPFRQKLIDHSLAKGDFETALLHLDYLIENFKDNDAYLLKAGSINLQQLGRPDKALSFFERYSQKHPDNREIKQKIKNIQSILANDFLSIVENDGAWFLWRDLAKVTPNRAAIYLEMAKLLEQRGMIKELLDILTIIHQHSPDDEILSLRIAQLYYDLKQYDRADGFLDNITHREKRTKAYYVLRGNIERSLGRETEALTFFETALQLAPGDLVLRKTALALAGALGNPGRMKILFEDGVRYGKGRTDPGILLTYLDQLAKNFLFHQYELVSTRFRANFIRDQKTLDRIDLHRAAALRQEGKTRRAEQMLRQLLQDRRSVTDVLLMLFDNALTDKNLTAATIWYNALAENASPETPEFPSTTDGCRRLLRKVRLLKAEGRYGEAEQLIGYYRKGLQGKGANEEPAASDLADLDKELCWLSFYLEDYPGALARIEKFAGNDGFDPEIWTLQGIVARKTSNAEVGTDLNGRLFVSDKPMAHRLVAVVETDLAFQEYDAAARHLQILRTFYPDSVTGRTLSARLLLGQGKFDEAVSTLAHLHEQFPAEPFFSRKLVEIEVRRGNYGKGLVLLERKMAGETDIEAIDDSLSASTDIEESLTLARLLWGDKQHEKALQIYRQLLSPSVVELLSEKFHQKHIDFLELTQGKKTIWNSVKQLLHSEPDVIFELMEPAFLVDNLTSEAGKVVAEHYELYSWQKLITTEYLARKAVFERNYSFAEQSYKRLLDEEENPEGMKDLAAIYGRIGKYRKEAQVYEAIQNTGTTSPELEKSMERSSLQMSPQNIFDISYKEEEGRSGFIDMAKLSSGTSFWFSPDLNTDIRLVYANNRYDSVNTSASATSNLLYGSTIYEFAKDYELTLGGGAEKMDGISNAKFLYQMAVKGQLDENFHAYIEWEKSLVYDTVEAIKEGVSQQGIETGLYCETPFGLTFGGDFRHRNYSDSNTQNRFHGYTSYGLFGETIQLSFRYDYQHFANTDTNPADRQPDEVLPQDVLFYWSPSTFSENLLTLHFQHDFLGYQQGTKRGISYYAIDTSVGYEDPENIAFTSKFDIFLEMNPHFLLKGNFTFTVSDVFEEKGLSLSLHYRW